MEKEEVGKGTQGDAPEEPRDAYKTEKGQVEGHEPLGEQDYIFKENWTGAVVQMSVPKVQGEKHPNSLSPLHSLLG